MSNILIRYVKHYRQNKDISSFDLILFFRQLATLFHAGIPIIECFSILEKSQTKKKFRLLIYTIKCDLLAGKSLHQSIQQHSPYFNTLTYQLIKTGEHTGQLPTLLITIADYHEKNHLLKQRIKQALFYPCLILTTASLVTFCMFFFIIPKFAELFATSSAQLPWITRCLFILSCCLHDYLFIFLLMAFVIFLSISHKPWRKQLQIHLKQAFFHSPPFSNVINKIILATFIRHLAITYTSGIPLPHGLTLAETINNSKKYRRTILLVRNRLQAGLQLHKAMQCSNYFPTFILQMIKAGEEAGRLDHMLNKIADLLETDIEQIIQQYSKLLEPCLLVFLGILMGSLIVGMYLPIFKLGTVL